MGEREQRWLPHSARDDADSNRSVLRGDGVFARSSDLRRACATGLVCGGKLTGETVRTVRIVGATSCFFFSRFEFSLSWNC